MFRFYGSGFRMEGFGLTQDSLPSASPQSNPVFRKERAGQYTVLIPPVILVLYSALSIYSHTVIL